MAEAEFTLTREGYERLKAEMTELEAEQQDLRKQLEDFNQDDTSSAEDEAARFDAQTRKEFVDEHIGHLRYVLERAQVIDKDLDPQHISDGDRVVVWDVGARQEQVFHLVSGEEIVLDGDDNTVATDSPVGKALLGHRAGDTVSVNIPDGWVRYTIRTVNGLGK